MTLDAHIQFAPLATLERMNDPAWNHTDRALYDGHALSFMPGTTEVPLLVDHDKDRQVGVVKRLYRIEEPDGPWLAASCHVTSPPGWLTRDTKASFAFIPIQHSSFTQPGDAEHLRKAWVTEVSILSPGTQPAEPRAKVTLLEPSKPTKPPAAATSTSVAHAARTPVHRTPVSARKAAEMDELNRRLEFLEEHGIAYRFEDVLENLKAELGGPTLDRLYAQHLRHRRAA